MVHPAEVVFSQRTPAADILRCVRGPGIKTTYPVVDDARKLVGVVTADAVATLAAETDLHRFVVAADLMHAPVSVSQGDTLAMAFELMRIIGLQQIPVVDADHRLAGVLDELAIAREYLRLQTTPAEHERSRLSAGLD